MIRRGQLFGLPNLDTLTSALVLIRLGQELGTDTPVARAVAGLVEALLTTLAGLTR